MQRILVATDGSPSSAEAVAFAVELAGEHDSELIFAHVVRTVDVVPATGFGSIGGALPHEPTEHDYALLEEAAAVAAGHAIVPTTVLLRGDTVDEIVAYADSHDVDLIVVGSRGRGALAGALLGSVSRGIIGESKRPVLVVRAAAAPAESVVPPPPLSDGEEPEPAVAQRHDGCSRVTQAVLEHRAATRRRLPATPASARSGRAPRAS